MNPFPIGTAEHLAWERSKVNPFAYTDTTAAAQLLDDVHTFLGRFVAYPNTHAHVAHTLWVAHAHLMDAWESTPRIAFLSPEPGSGKTRALEVSELLVPNAVEAVNVTPAYLFRKVGEASPTILYDEIDTVFGPKAKENEEIRGLLNAGHRRGAVAGRCVVKGKIIETEEIPAYCAVALAGLGGLPDTLLSRSVVISMKRRGPGEKVEAYRRRVHETDGHKIRDRLETWAVDTIALASQAWPVMPNGIQDRDADKWEPLLTVADAAGGDWPERARCCAVALVALSKAGGPSLGVRLLGDLRTVFGDRDVMSTEVILDNLTNLEEAPWAEIRKGKPLNARGLAGYLRQYDIRSKVVRVGDATPHGYSREDLYDAWSRYLYPLGVSVGSFAVDDKTQTLNLGPPHLEDATSATNATGNGSAPDPETALAVHCDRCGQALLHRKSIEAGRCARCRQEAK